MKIRGAQKFSKIFCIMEMFNKTESHQFLRSSVFMAIQYIRSCYVVFNSHKFNATEVQLFNRHFRQKNVYYS
jgi:hypothetical protein